MYIYIYTCICVYVYINAYLLEGPIQRGPMEKMHPRNFMQVNYIICSICRLKSSPSIPLFVAGLYLKSAKYR